MAYDPELSWRVVGAAQALIAGLEPESVLLYTFNKWGCSRHIEHGGDPVAGLQITFRDGRQVCFNAARDTILSVATRDGEKALAARQQRELVEEVERLRARVAELEGEAQ